MNTTPELIRRYAVEAGAKWPDLVVAQWRIESGSGKYTAARCNYFGLKGPGNSTETTEYINGKPVTIKDQFINFNSPQECVEYLVDRWYKDYKGYKGVNNAASVEEAARMLQSEGYATDPAYAKKLIGALEKMPASDDFADLLDAVENYRGLEHQKRAFQDLQRGLSKEERAGFTRTWRTPSSPAQSNVTKKGGPLKVPYFGQLDSKTNHAERMCFSSSMAMALDYINPKAIEGDDDWYLRKVLQYGDTVSSAAQVAAARSLGFKADFKTDGSEKDLIRLIDACIPVPIGILHKGPIGNPTGGGHWITVIGYNETHFYVNDPRGDLDLVNGDYPSRTKSGQGLLYTRKNLMKRWLIGGPSDGWYVEISR